MRLNRICSDISFFDKRCNELESWLIRRGYNEKKVRDKVLAARKHNRIELLNKEKSEKQKKLVLNITYHPALKRLGSILKHIHVLLACDKEHKKVFQDIPIVGFKRGKSLKDLLVRAKVPPVCNLKGGSSKCLGKRCGVCTFVENTTEFTSKTGKTYDIRSH